MAPLDEFVVAVDAFMQAPNKVLAGAGRAPQWQRGRDADEQRLLLPIEVDGEQHGQMLMICAYPDNPSLMFRVGIKFISHVVCRLDYEDGTHANNFNAPDLPSFIHGPHWHSWEINRHHISSIQKHSKLPNAVQYAEARHFDATLRWYCAKRRITIGQHAIAMPPRGRLI